MSERLSKLRTAGEYGFPSLLVGGLGAVLAKERWATQGPPPEISARHDLLTGQARELENDIGTYDDVLAVLAEVENPNPRTVEAIKADQQNTATQMQTLTTEAKKLDVSTDTNGALVGLSAAAGILVGVAAIKGIHMLVDLIPSRSAQTPPSPGV